MLRGVTLQELDEEMQRIGEARELAGACLGRGELSRLERGQRWVNPQQLVALAAAHQVRAGRVAEWILEALGLLADSSTEGD